MKKFRGLYDAFVEFLDGLYFEGYTEQLKNEFPELFAFEWKQFQESFS
jgi:hypothetical protein